MSLKSLDPRVTRLHIPEADEAGEMNPLAPLDQFETYEVFHQRKEGTPFTHVGPVHAPNEQAAFLFGKEQYSRRFPCVGMWVAKTQNIMVTPHTDTHPTAYDFIQEDQEIDTSSAEAAYEIFHQKKRGKSHQHMGRVMAASHDHALRRGKEQFGHDMPCVNVWVIKSSDLFQTDPQDKDMWLTTPEKKYRDAIAYKVQDRINQFKQEQQAQNA